MEATFPQSEKLKQKRDIDELFAKGKWVSAGNFRLIYRLQTNNKKIGVSVSKKYFKKAHDRNRYKRLLREIYRLNKEHFNTTFGENAHLMLFYVASKPATFHELQQMMFDALQLVKRH